jgi:hypothetical protein
MEPAVMAAIVRDYTIERGIPFSREIDILLADNSPLDLTGVTFLADVRLSKLPTDISAVPPGTGAFQTAFVCTAANPVDGKLIIALTTVQTLALPRGVYDYDVVLTFPSGDKRRILMGVLTVVEIASHA